MAEVTAFHASKPADSDFTVDVLLKSQAADAPPLIIDKAPANSAVFKMVRIIGFSLFSTLFFGSAKTPFKGEIHKAVIFLILPPFKAGCWVNMPAYGQSRPAGI